MLVEKYLSAFTVSLYVGFLYNILPADGLPTLAVRASTGILVTHNVK